MELRILDWFQTWHNPALDQIMIFITRLGDAGIVWIGMAAALLLLPKTRTSGLIVALALIFDLILCNGILKNLFARIRPFNVNTAVELLIAKPIDFSFPSGHTAASFATISALFFAGEKKLWKAALVLGILIAISRMYLYVHYPTDILGGLLAGVLAGFLGAKCGNWIVQRIKNRG